MATHGEIRWPPAGTFSGRLRGDFHGRRHLKGTRLTGFPRLVRAGIINRLKLHPAA